MLKSSNVVLFWHHKLQTCNCGENNCPICAGGLAHCVTCGGAEGSLPQDCPQRLMTEVEEAAVYAGELDFRHEEGGWTKWTRSHMLANKRRLT